MIDAAEAAEIRRAEWDVSEFLGKIRIFVGDTSAHEALYDGLRERLAISYALVPKEPRSKNGVTSSIKP